MQRLVRRSGNDPLGRGNAAMGIVGTGPFASSDFTTVLRDVASGETASFVVASFAGTSLAAIGADHAPEPGTVRLLGLGLVGISILRRRF
jgi:hypothetical protein